MDIEKTFDGEMAAKMVLAAVALQEETGLRAAGPAVRDLLIRGTPKMTSAAHMKQGYQAQQNVEYRLD